LCRRNNQQESSQRIPGSPGSEGDVFLDIAGADTIALSCAAVLDR